MTAAPGPQQPDEVEVDPFDEVRRERAELERLARKYDLDNHHNAAMCPYCRPAAPSAQPDEVHEFPCGWCGEPDEHGTHCPSWTPAQPVRDTGEGRR